MWLTVTIGVVEATLGSKNHRVTDGSRGCDYCASDDNMYYEHVERVASSEALGLLLLRCPHCGWMYETDPTGMQEPRHLNENEARCRFDY